MQRLSPVFCFLLLVCQSYNGLAQQSLPPNTRHKLDIERAFAPEVFKSVLLGETETLILLQESNLALTKGLAILVGETGRNGISDHALAMLAPQLNNVGWTTALVSAPALEFKAKEAAAADSVDDDTSNESSNESQSSAKLPPPHQYIGPEIDTGLIDDALFTEQKQAFQLLISTVQQERENYPGFLLVVAQGTSAAWLADLYVEETLPSPDAMVSLGINWPQHNLNQRIPELIAKTEFPVLDITNQFDSRWSQNTAAGRKVAALKALKLHYRQREIIGPQLQHYQMDYLTREIHGWLTYLGW